MNDKEIHEKEKTGGSGNNGGHVVDPSLAEPVKINYTGLYAIAIAILILMGFLLYFILK